MCVGRAVRCACGAVTRPRAQSTITFFADRSRLQQNKTAHGAPASACCSSPQNTRRCHRCCICTLSILRRITLPAFGGLVLAWPRGTGHAFVSYQCGANHLPCNCDVDDSGFLRMRCVNSPGATRVPQANKIIVPLQPPKNKPNAKIL